MLDRVEFIFADQYKRGEEAVLASGRFRGEWRVAVEEESKGGGGSRSGTTGQS